MTGGSIASWGKYGEASADQVASWGRAWVSVYVVVLEWGIQFVDRAAIDPVFHVATGAGNKFLNNEFTWLHVRNGDEDVNITIEVFEQIDIRDFAGVPLDVGNRIVNIPANEERLIGVFQEELYSDPVDMMVKLSYDNASNVTIALMTYTE